MDTSSDMRAQLQSLRIAKEHRPAVTGRMEPHRWVMRLLAGCIVLAVAGAGLYLGRERISLLIGGATQVAAEVRLVSVTSGRGPEPEAVLIATGKIVSDHRVQVATKVSGQIVALHFEQGDRVEKGRILARIEDVNYRARRDEAAARLARAKANLAYQRINLARVDGLYERGGAPAIEHADVKRAAQESEAQVAAEQAALDFAEKALNDCEVVAPITGVILERNVEVGDFVAAEGGRGMMANSQFGAIADMSKLRLEVDISELDIARVRKDMPCIVTPDGYKDRRYRGRVMWIDPGANYAKATVGVKVRIEQPDAYLRVEGSAQVMFLAEEPPVATTTQAASGIWIPASACLCDPSGNSATVFVAEDGVLRATSVRVGRRTASQVEVTDGLSEGQSIAVSGLEKLQDGQRLRS